MFILIGLLAYHARITQGLFRCMQLWFGSLPGGLAIATVFAAAAFGAVSGASTATAAVFSRVAIPEMLRYRYSPALAAGVVAAGGTLASLIPPSGILVIYAIIVEGERRRAADRGRHPRRLLGRHLRRLDRPAGHAQP